VRAAHVVGQAGGWGIVIRYGLVERALAASRSRDVRLFKKLETVVGYLRASDSAGSRWMPPVTTPTR
jgi:hypothetical protein